MRTVGVLTVALLAAGVAFTSVIVARSLPDIQRYLKIRSM
jgi:Family of unknown function (DUF6893)